MQVDETSPCQLSVGIDNDDNLDEITTALLDEERGLGSSGRPATSHTSRSSQHPLDDSTEPRARPNTGSDSHSATALAPNTASGGGAGNYIKRKTSQILEALSSGSTPAETPLNPLLTQLVQAYASSQIAADLRAEINQNGEPHSAAPGTGSRDVVEESVNIRGRRRASYATQFRILSGRAFKNLYRNPALLTAHYVSSIFIACEFLSACLHSTTPLHLAISQFFAGSCSIMSREFCMSFYRYSTLTRLPFSNDIPGFQNRLGVFFFTLALFGFSCLSSLGLFAGERVLFIRER